MFKRLRLWLARRLCGEGYSLVSRTESDILAQTLRRYVDRLGEAHCRLILVRVLIGRRPPRRRWLALVRRAAVIMGPETNVLEAVESARAFVQDVYDFRPDEALEAGAMPFNTVDYYTMESLMAELDRVRGVASEGRAA